jgi:hypothetical protein
MGKILLICVGLVVLVVIGGTGFLMVWDVPPPAVHVEKVLPDARFPR